jgi:RNA polymerase sigma-70 factor (ECF subfamily)
MAVGAAGAGGAGSGRGWAVREGYSSRVGVGRGSVHVADRRPSVDERPGQDGERRGLPVAEAFDDLFQAYEQRIFNLVYRLVGDYDDAADLTADTFVRALRAYQHFRGEAHPYTWLYRIALNLCKNYFRQQQHRSRVHSFSLDSPADHDGEALAREIEDSSQEPHQRVQAKELEAQVAKCLLSLRPELRALIVLRDLQGLSYQEIGRVLGCSEKAVKSRLFRARSQLREALGPYLSE